MLDDTVECKATQRESTRIETYNCLYREHGIIQNWIPVISILTTFLLVIRKIVQRKGNFRKGFNKKNSKKRRYLKKCEKKVKALTPKPLEYKNLILFY